MDWFDDKQILNRSGLDTPYLASDPLLSGITGMSVMTHRLYPGMAGAHQINDQWVCALFVERLPVEPQINGLLSSRSGLGTLTHIQAGFQAWQFELPMTSAQLYGHLAQVVIFVQWTPGAFGLALEKHDAMVSETLPAETWLIGSAYEKEAYSRFLLDASESSFLRPYFMNGQIFQAIQQMNSPLVITEGPATAMLCTEVDWFTTTE